MNHLPTKYRYSDIPEFQPEPCRFSSVEEQERDVLEDIFQKTSRSNLMMILMVILTQQSHYRQKG